MLKICDLNFKTQTIGNIEINGLNINNLEIKLTKTKFNITFNKETKKEIKKKKNEDIIEFIEIEPQEEPQEEETQEEKQEETQEEKQEEKQEEETQEETQEEGKITLQQMKELLTQTITKKNTLEAYYRPIKAIYQHFKILNMYELLKTKEKEIIEYIEEEYKNNHSTIKSKLCGIKKAYEILKIDGLLIEDKTQEYIILSKIQQDKKKEANKKDESEGKEIIDTFKKHLEELEEKIKEDTGILTKWKQEAQLYFILKIYLEYGVLRPSELIKCLITNTDDGNDKINYININSKMMIINNHKNDKKGKKEFLLDEKLIKGLKIGLGKYLITNEEGELYESSSSLTKLFVRKFNHTPYDLRRAISSKAIAEKNTDKIKQLENIQGHALNVVLSHYNIYSKENKENI